MKRLVTGKGRTWMPVLAAMLAVAATLSSCMDRTLARKLEELDAALSRQREFTAEFEAGAAPLRDSLLAARSDSARWEAAYGIYSIFKCTQMDSALHYLRKMKDLSAGNPHEQFLCGIEEASVNISARNYPSVRSFLESVDTSALDKPEKNRFYETVLLLFATEAHDETLPPEELEKSIRRRHETRRQYIASAVGDPFEAVRRPAIQLYEDGKADQAIPILADLARTAPPGQRAHACYSLAKAHQAAGDRTMTEYWFAQSAIENIKRPSAEHLSLYELSMMLFEDQRLGRALSYSQAVLESELESHYNTWIINSASSQLGIVRAAQLRERQQRRIALAITVLITLLSLTIFAIGIKTIRQAQKIRLMNRRLEEAGKIKEGYVFRYVMLSSRYLRMIEDYRHNLRVTLKEEGVDALKQKLRQTEIENLNPKQFYAIFDETFLGIFPDFVSHVNSLLKEGARFKVKDGNDLPTGLRILAVIKLGITESGRIAQFLDCAISSVYTHRCRLRNSAVCPPEDFERLVAET